MPYAFGHFNDSLASEGPDPSFICKWIKWKGGQKVNMRTRETWFMRDKRPYSKVSCLWARYVEWWLHCRLLYLSLEAGSGWWGKRPDDWVVFWYFPVNPWTAYALSALCASIRLFHCCFCEVNVQELCSGSINTLACVLIGWMEAQGGVHCSLCFLTAWKWIAVKPISCKQWPRHPRQTVGQRVRRKTDA